MKNELQPQSSQASLGGNFFTENDLNLSPNINF